MNIFLEFGSWGNFNSEVLENSSGEQEKLHTSKRFSEALTTTCNNSNRSYYKIKFL